MNIFNPDEYLMHTHLILCPDLNFHTSFNDENLNEFFRKMVIPKNVQYLVSIYIEYEFVPYLYEKYPDVYFKTSQSIQDEIEKYMDFDNSYLYHCYNNTFYLVMFDVNEEQLLLHFTKLYQNLKNKKTTYHKHESEFRICCGVYISNNLRIGPVDFYNSARRQFLNTQLHHRSIISVLKHMIF